MDDEADEKDESKRKSRNLSEKKRRDQFNHLVNELSSMVSSTNRKMDKSTVLKSTIAFLKQHNEVELQSRLHEIQENWKPSFLSNEEFTHLVLEAIEGFIMVFSSNGQIFYASENIISLLGHLPSDLLTMTIYDLAYEEEHSDLYNILINPVSVVMDSTQKEINLENQVCFTCHLKRGALDVREDITYDLVQFTGYFSMRCDVAVDKKQQENCYPSETEKQQLLFFGTGRVQTAQFIREMSMVETKQNEFTSRHSLEWKFLFLDHRASPIIGYLPFEVLGTSGYDYYHFDDLEKIVMCHETLMQKGEGKSCYYRFLTKGQQWLWLQTRFYLSYHQWSSKAEFIVCTHRAVNYADIMKQSRNINAYSHTESNISSPKEMEISSHIYSGSDWSDISGRGSSYITSNSTSVQSHSRRSNQNEDKSDSTSVFNESGSSRNTVLSQYSSRSRIHHGSQHKRRSHHFPQKLHTQHKFSVPAGSNSLQEVSSTHVLSGKNYSISSMNESTSFLEPQQYLATIPLQPCIRPNFQGATEILSSMPISNSISDILPTGVILTNTQTHIQEELQRKHEELEQLIVQQQEELRRVSEQLSMARSGILTHVYNMPLLAYDSISNNHSITDDVHMENHLITSTTPPQMTEQHFSSKEQNGTLQNSIDSRITRALTSEQDETISYMSLDPVPISHLNSITIDTENDKNPKNQQSTPE